MRLACTSFALMSAAALAVTAPPANTSHLLPPTELRCSNLVEPLAVAEAQPELSWQLTASSAELHAVSQSAYEIQVAVQSGAGGGQSVLKPVLWNSGVVHSAATFGVLYAGPALEAQRSYVWQVRVWDEQGHASGWSRIAHWTEAPTWQAHWIEAPSTGSAAEPMPIFRKSFALDKPVTRALLYASGMGQDELHINGQKVGKDELTPGWSEYRKTVYYDSYDVTSLLRNGENALGIMLGNGMYRVLLTPGRYTKFVGSYGPPKCIVQLHVEFADGEAMDVAGIVPASTMRNGRRPQRSRDRAERCYPTWRLRCARFGPIRRMPRPAPNRECWSTIWARTLQVGPKSPFQGLRARR